jgi:hypothetical protein
MRERGQTEMKRKRVGGWIGRVVCCPLLFGRVYERMVTNEYFGIDKDRLLRWSLVVRWIDKQWI